MRALKPALHSINLRGSPENTVGSGAGSLVRVTDSCKACINASLCGADCSTRLAGDNRLELPLLCTERLDRTGS